MAAVVSSATSAGAQEATNTQAEAIYNIVFPVAGDHAYVDSWGAPRSEERTHEGTDIFAAKGTPVVAAADGKVVRVASGDRAGRYIVVEHDGGWRSYYLHLNNDTPDTDDGLSDTPAAGIAVGVSVAAGDVLDYVGDSGNAEGTRAHLHFEIHHPDGTATNPYPHLRSAESLPFSPTTLQTTPAESGPTYQADNVSVVGRFDPGDGFAADITVHNEVAYLGTWGRPEACPASGVRMIDVSDPAEPAEIGTIASGSEFPGTSTDSVWVGAVETAVFTGDLAAVAVRLCDTSEGNRSSDMFRGLALYDVSEPAAPLLLSTLSSGDRTQGIHELDLVTRKDGTVLAAITSPQSVRHTEGTAGDLRIVDLTDPASPFEVSDWDLRRDGTQPDLDEMLSQVYDDLEIHAHSATWTPDGMGLWVANWDAGVTFLDTTDASSPVAVNTFGFDPETEGNAHSVSVDAAAGVLIRNDQDLVTADLDRHQRGWGGQRFYDISDPENVGTLGTFMTDRSKSGEDGVSTSIDGRYSAHNAVLLNGIDYAAWYSDGLRIVDVSDPTAPEELGWFIPPVQVDPQDYWAAPDGVRSLAMVWGVHVTQGLIYVSDMNSGLWIVRYAPPPQERVAVDDHLPK